jgi:hypothetical protein
MLTFDFEPAKRKACECCGGVTTTLTRFVYEDGQAYAVYYARFADNHPDRIVQAIVSIGDWGEDSGPWDRVAFPFEIRVAETGCQVGLTDAADSPWQDTDVLGRVLDRQEALEHERLQEVFHISDHMVSDDQPLREYLGGNKQ